MNPVYAACFALLILEFWVFFEEHFSLTSFQVCFLRCKIAFVGFVFPWGAVWLVQLQ